MGQSEREWISYLLESDTTVFSNQTFGPSTVAPSAGQLFAYTCPADFAAAVRHAAATVIRAVAATTASLVYVSIDVNLAGAGYKIYEVDMKVGNVVGDKLQVNSDSDFLLRAGDSIRVFFSDSSVGGTHWCSGGLDIIQFLP